MLNGAAYVFKPDTHMQLWKTFNQIKSGDKLLNEEVGYTFNIPFIH